jgi:hypothetical protein
VSREKLTWPRIKPYSRSLWRGPVRGSVKCWHSRRVVPDRAQDRCHSNPQAPEALRARSAGPARADGWPRTLLQPFGYTLHSGIRKVQNLACGWCWVAAWRVIKRVLRRSGIIGRQACPRGLRHAFGVGCLQPGVPPARPRADKHDRDLCQCEWARGISLC